MTQKARWIDSLESRILLSSPAQPSVPAPALATPAALDMRAAAPGSVASASIATPDVTGPDLSVTDGATTIDSTTDIDFGSAVLSSTPPTQTFTVTNTGDSGLTLGTITLPTGFSLVATPAATVAAGDFTTFSVQMDTDAADSPSGTLSVPTNVAGENPFTFTISGTVTAPAEPQIKVLLGVTPLVNGSPTPISFGSATVGATPPTKTFTIDNTGTADLDLGTVTLPTGFTLTAAPPSTILAGDDATFTVSMSTSTVGPLSGQMSFTTDDPDNPTFALNLSGTVNAAPVSAVSVTQGATLIPNNSITPISFGNVVQGGGGASLVFTVTNSGSGTLDLSALSVPSGFAVTSSFAPTVAAGDSTSFIVLLQSRSIGTPSGNITFTTNDPSNPSFVIPISGVVVVAPEPQMVVQLVQRSGLTTITDGEASPISFGNGVQGYPALTETFEVTNDGTATLSIGRMSTSAGFTVVTPLPATIAAGANATFVISMSTATIGTINGTVSFANGIVAENPFTFSVTGNIVAAAPSLSIGLVERRNVGIIPNNATRAVNFGTVLQGARTPEFTFTIYNNGTSTLSLAHIYLPAGFVLVQGSSRSIAVGASSNFIIGLSTRYVGTFTGVIELTSNDSRNSPYNLAVAGVVSGVTAGVSGDGTLTVDGTSGNDVITFKAIGRHSIDVIGDGNLFGGSPFNGVTKIVVNCGAGNDYVSLAGMGLNGTLNGDSGNNTLIAGAGDDVLNGGTGNDSLVGGSGSDQLLGNDGNDTLIAGTAPDVLKGGNGNDFINAQNGIADILVDGGPGNDVVRVDRVDPWTGT